MRSAAPTVDAYLAALPEERRDALQAVRAVILANLDPDLEEVMQYGMIGYVVPHRVYPPGYHCDPKQPLCYAGLASQKQHMALYLMCAYGDAGERAWLEQAWKAAGKKLDMGKSCLRFRKLEDLPLEVIGEAFRRVSAEAFIKATERALGGSREARKAPAKAIPSGNTAAKKAGARSAAAGKAPAAR